MFSRTIKIPQHDEGGEFEIVGRRDPDGIRRGQQIPTDDDVLLMDEYSDYEFISIENFRRYSWGRILFLLLLIGILISSSIGIGFAFRSNYHHGSSSGNTFGEGIFMITDPPSNLEELCTSENLQSDDGYLDCYHACAPSQCCDLVESNRFSCFAAHPATCKVYHTSCQHLIKKKSETIAAPGDNTVDEICSTNSLKSGSGVQKCKESCKDIMCCFADPGSYAEPCDIPQVTCSQNSACSALLYIDANGFDSHQEIVNTVDEVCSDLGNYENAVKCSNLCRSGQCCFPSRFPVNNTCEHIECEHYTACDELYGPSNLYVGDDEDDNEDGDNDDDDDYLPTFFADIDKITSELTDTCTPDSILTIKGVKACLSLCQQHFCCFTEDQSENCRNNMETNECQLYEPCRILLDNDKPNENWPILEVCSEEYIISHNTNHCLGACGSHLCCLVDDQLTSSCMNNDDHCSPEYKACTIFGPNTKAPIENDKLLEEIESHCSDDSLKILAGRQKCEFYCLHRECCVAEGAGNCQHTDPSFCSEVKDCNKLIQGPATETDRAVGINEICSRDSISTLAGFHKCYDKCYYNLCCFLPAFSEEYELNCYDMNPKICEEYSACSILIESNIMSTSASEVDHACLSLDVDTIDGFRKCHSLCASHVCCFQDVDAPSSCLGLLGFAECDEYMGCQFLSDTKNHPVPANNDDPDVVSRVQSICTPEIIASAHGREACRRECEKRACCFFPGNKGCDITNQDWCEPMQPCHLIFGECEIASCCFEPSNQGGCYDERKNWCDGFVDCSVVLGSGLNPPP